VRWQLQRLGDEDLLEFAQYLQLPVCRLDGPVDDPWHSGQVRAFLSHVSRHKEFVGEVAGALAARGIHGFVAHDTIEVTREWQDEIERALSTCDVLVGFVHTEFNASVWCQQEVGWAYGRGIPTFFLRFDAVPSAFAAKTQWPPGLGDDPQLAARHIHRWANTIDRFSERLAGQLIAALADAHSYVDAGNAADALTEFGRLTPTQWAALDRVFWANDQVFGGVLARRGLAPLYERNGRPFPPPQPELATTDVQPEVLR
jgi:hypothetical protein